MIKNVNVILYYGNDKDRDHQFDYFTIEGGRTKDISWTLDLLEQRREAQGRNESNAFWSHTYKYENCLTLSRDKK